MHGVGAESETDLFDLVSEVPPYPDCVLLEKSLSGGCPITMKTNLRKLPLGERIRLVEDLWDSIASDRKVLPFTPEQQAELNRRLDTCEADGHPGRPVEDVIEEIRKRL